MSRNIFEPGSIIWAADVKKKTVEKVLESGVLPEGTIVKLDRLFFEENDKDFIDWCQEKGYPVFVDAKICDNAERALGIAHVYLKHHPAMLGCLGDICSNMAIVPSEFDEHIDTLKKFVDRCISAGTDPCLTTMLSGKTDAMCAKEFKASLTEQTRVYAGMAIRMGVSNIVCGAREAKILVKQPAYARLTMNVFGIRMDPKKSDSKSDKTSDKKSESKVKERAKMARIRETMTPAEAFGKHIDRLIIGREMVRGDNKVDIVDRVATNYRRIVENIYGIEDSETSIDDLPEIVIPEFHRKTSEMAAV